MTRALTLVLTLLVAVLGAGATSRSGRAEEEGPEHKASAAPAVVRTAIAVERTLRPTFGVMGTVATDPLRVATLAAHTSGIVSRIAVPEGAHVVKEDIVIELSQEKPRIDLERARAAFARLVARPRPEDLEVARRTIAKARAAEKLVRSKLEAASSLRRENSRLVPSLQIQEQARDLEVTRAEAQAAELQLRLLELGPKPQQRHEAQVEVDAAELALRWCQIRSPLPGVVSDLKARVGMHVEPGAPLATVTDQSVVLVVARVPGQRLAGVLDALKSSRGNGREGPLAAVRAAAFAGERFEGTVLRLGQETEGQTGDVPVWVRVPNPDQRLRAGMSVQAELPGREITGVAIPEIALSIDDEGRHVVTAIRGGKAAPQVVELVAGDAESRTGGQVLLREGIKPGEEVAVENGYALPSGYPVTRASASPAAPGDKGRK